ncbi:hypothetical protein H632_c4353p0, partial [Helicosporidium sp. ATCC 50920]
MHTIPPPLFIGPNSGIGFACAQALGLEGSKVVLGDVSKDDLDQAKSS